jgi:CDP-diacylglycerol--glycerol-3-phosphate 3-phosphatidyltransferase
MKLANKITSLRVILAPVFFFFYFFPTWFTYSAEWTTLLLWLIFIISEITDYLDGLAARKLNETSDTGKFFDPFADTLMQITCFLCFVIDGVLPAFLFLAVIYREFGILFIRNLMLNKGIIMGARISGKIKTVSYIIALGAALLVISFQRLSVFEFLIPHFKTGAVAIFIVSVVISLVSFIDYYLIFRKEK